MDEDKKAKLEAAGWVETTVEEFLGIEDGEDKKAMLKADRWVEPTHATFTVTIDDSYCEWTFAFGLPSSACIQDVVDAIAKAFNVEAPDGKMTRGYCD